MSLTIGAAGIALIKQFEGCARKRPDGRFEAYPDPASGGAPWTIGWGTTGTDVRKGTIWTQAQCDQRVAVDVAHFASQVASLIGLAPTTQNQFDAMVCLAYNIGPPNLKASTLLARHKVRDYAGAQEQFARWNKADGKVMAGLIKRRAAEAALYGRAS
jgi:GH24 family phage-related lysozyme (muramidase)